MLLVTIQALWELQLKRMCAGLCWAVSITLYNKTVSVTVTNSGANKLLLYLSFDGWFGSSNGDKPWINTQVFPSHCVIVLYSIPWPVQCSLHQLPSPCSKLRTFVNLLQDKHNSVCTSVCAGVTSTVIPRDGINDKRYDPCHLIPFSFPAPGPFQRAALKGRLQWRRIFVSVGLPSRLQTLLGAPHLLGRAGFRRCLSVTPLTSQGWPFSN